ncbi:MAG: addiction module protein [Candidatus Hydrogenedentes bacterium]|nr:addiction module protein [Candidatus Hydrogenedentota bacterium]
MALPEEKYALDLLGLPRNARARLAAKLIASLDDDEEDDVDEAWAREIDRRSSEIDEGRVDCIPGDSAMERARRSIQ